jgi:hypothetical protein
MRGIQYAAACRLHHRRLGLLDRPLQPVIGRRDARGGISAMKAATDAATSAKIARL